MVVTSATVTIGSEIPSEESNVHEKVVVALSAKKVLPLNETNSDIYVVRPDHSFLSDSDSNYLEIHYPDLLPFGRAGTSEKRRIPIS